MESHAIAVTTDRIVDIGGSYSHSHRITDLLASLNNTGHCSSNRVGLQDSPPREDGFDQDSSVSYCESIVSGDDCKSPEYVALDDGLIRLDEEDAPYRLIQERLLSGLGCLRQAVKVVSIRRNGFSGVMRQARLRCFQIYAQAMENKLRGNANVKYAWFGTSKDGVHKILSHGFGFSGKKLENDGLYGSGVYLSPDNSPLESVKSSEIDEEGLRHVILCRVILGRVEVVHPGSDQSHPSSEEFDSGVDSFLAPKKYIIWNTNVGTHILPEYVISFKAPPRLRACSVIDNSLRKPTSPWLPFSTLISELAKHLPRHTIRSITKFYNDHKERKISRYEMIQRVRQLTGDKLLIAVIKSFRTKDNIRQHDGGTK